MYSEHKIIRYMDMKDEEIVKLASNGDEMALDYILNKYKYLVKIKGRTYFIKGADKEDIIQEGMIGLYKAIRDYQYDRNMTFKGFAEMCITRQMITAIKSATRQKHMPLNTYVSLNKHVSNEDSDRTYTDVIFSDKDLNPEELLIGKESKDFIEKHINQSLTRLECVVLELYLRGKNYSEISSIINKPEKSIDNALQRVRRKLEKLLKENNN